jgi:hypothetical protein
MLRALLIAYALLLVTGHVDRPSVSVAKAAELITVKKG